MKKTKKMLACMAAVCLTAGLFAGCGGVQSTQTPAPASAPTQAAEPGSMPIVSTPITIKIMTMKMADQVDWNDMLWTQEMERITGIKVEWDMVGSDMTVERRNIVLATNDLPDAFMRMPFGATEVEEYGTRQGLLIRLDEMIESLAPNVKQMLAEDADLDKGIRMSDGGIYGLPSVTECYSPRMTAKYFFNKNMLNNIGMELPETTDQLFDVLKAYKEYDNASNPKKDGIAISGTGTDGLYLVLRGAWGLGTRGQGGVSGHLDVDKNGDFRYVPASAEYRELLEYINKLYKNDLIDEDFFSLNYALLSGKGEAGQVFSFYGPNNSYMGQQHQDEYTGLKKALTGPHGDKIWAGITPKLGNVGAFVITNKNKYPEETLRWADYNYSDEGNKLYFMGVEGITYEVTPEGTYEFLDIINNNPDGLSYQQAQGLYIPWAGGANPAKQTDETFKGPAMLPIPLEMANNMQPYTPKKIWSQFTFTKDENEINQTLGGDINKYVTESRAQFITGDKPFSDWDAYIAQLKQMGFDEYMAMLEGVAARYE